MTSGVPSSTALEAEVAVGVSSIGEQNRVTINLLPDCNNACVFCAGADWETAPLDRSASSDRLLELVAAHLANGAKSFTFQGGEPTLYGGLLSLVAFAHSGGAKHLQLVTNGRRLADMQYCRSLIEAGIDGFTVSVHGHTAEVHETISRKAGSFSEAIAGLRNLSLMRVDHDMTVSSHSVIVPSNLPYLANILDTLLECGLDWFGFSHCKPAGRAVNGYADLGLAFERMHDSLARLVGRARELNARLSFSCIPLCLVPEFSTILKLHVPVCGEGGLMNGTMENRQRTDVASGAQRDCLKVSSHDPMRQMERVEACFECDLWNRCPGVPSYYLKRFGLDEFHNRQIAIQPDHGSALLQDRESPRTLIEAFFAEGDRASDERDWSNAISAFKKVLEVQPDHPLARKRVKEARTRWLGELIQKLLMARRTSNAASLAELVLRLDPDNHHAREVLARWPDRPIAEKKVIQKRSTDCAGEL